RSLHERLGGGMTVQELVKRRWFWAFGLRRGDCEKQISNLGCRGNREAVEGIHHDVGLRAVGEMEFHRQAAWTRTGVGVRNGREPGRGREPNGCGNRRLSLL